MTIFDKTEQIANKLNLDFRKEEKKIIVSSSSYSAISLIMEIKDNKMLSYYYYHRTTSWVYDGERSDLHDCIPLMFCIFIKANNLSSAQIFDVINPATLDETEIYARYLFPVQKGLNRTNNKINNINGDAIDNLLLNLSIFESKLWGNFGCPCVACRERLDFTFNYKSEIEENNLFKISNAIEGSITNYCERNLPTWVYYKDVERGITVIKSTELINFLFFPYEQLIAYTEKVKGIGGTIHINLNFKNYVSDFELRKIKKYFKNLQDINPKIILIENKLVAFGQEYILIHDYNCGEQTFKRAKNKLKIRHEKEFSLLFKPSSLIWVDKIDDIIFEDLIKDLLEREPHVKRIRKVSHTNERDGGTDLIAEWKVTKENISKEDKTPYQLKNIIIQCKAYTNGVSKSNVTDIRDTVEFRNYDGYFLAVSSYLKKSLSDHLDKLRIDNKIWLDWWSRDEIETRLVQHHDLLIKYSSIVSINED